MARQDEPVDDRDVQLLLVSSGFDPLSLPGALTGSLTATALVTPCACC